MTTDSVDNLLIQWAEERPNLSLASLGVVVRIGRLAALMATRADRSLNALGLSLWEYDLLSALRRQGPPFQLSPTDLSRETLISSGAITNRVDRLEDKGLVTRETDPADRRAVIVGLSQDGLELTGAAITARVAAADVSLRGLNKRDREALARLLRSMLSNAESEETPDNAP